MLIEDKFGKSKRQSHDYARLGVPLVRGCCIALVCAFGAITSAENPSAILQVGDDRVVAAFTQIALTEPHLTVDPGNPNHLLAASVSVLNGTDLRAAGATTCYAFASLDGGNTWNANDFKLPNCVDVWTAITRGGVAIVSFLQPWPQGGAISRWR